MYFLWNNPASLCVEQIKIDDKEIDFNTERCGYRNSIHMSLKRVEDFKNLIDAYPVVKEKNNMEEFDKSLKSAKNMLYNISSSNIEPANRSMLNQLIKAIEFLADEVKKLKEKE